MLLRSSVALQIHPGGTPVPPTSHQSHDLKVKVYSKRPSSQRNPRIFVLLRTEPKSRRVAGQCLKRPKSLPPSYSESFSLLLCLVCEVYCWWCPKPAPRLLVPVLTTYSYCCRSGTRVRVAYYLTRDPGTIRPFFTLATYDLGFGDVSTKQRTIYSIPGIRYLPVTETCEMRWDGQGYRNDVGTQRGEI